jgi:hypothetical protein
MCSGGDTIRVKNFMFDTMELSRSMIIHNWTRTLFSFEMLNPPFKHCDSKESKKTLLAIEFSNMMISMPPNNC